MEYTKGVLYVQGAWHYPNTWPNTWREHALSISVGSTWLYWGLELDHVATTKSLPGTSGHIFLWFTCVLLVIFFYVVYVFVCLVKCLFVYDCFVYFWFLIVLFIYFVCLFVCIYFFFFYYLIALFFVLFLLFVFRYFIQIVNLIVNIFRLGYFEFFVKYWFNIIFGLIPRIWRQWSTQY